MSDQAQNGAEGELKEFAPSPAEARAMVRPEAFDRFREIIEASEGREWTDEEFLELVWCLTPEGRQKIHEAITDQKQPAPMAKVQAKKRDRQANTAKKETSA